jgi:hypothetical protein
VGGAFSMHVKRSGAYTILVRKTDKIFHLENPGLNGRIILKCILNK